MTVLSDWPEESHVSPFRLVPWRQACSDLDVSTNTLLKPCACNGIGVVTLTKRKRALLACDLVRLVRTKQKPAGDYAAAQRGAAA
jgi:hypothetical protein